VVSLDHLVVSLDHLVVSLDHLVVSLDHLAVSLDHLVVSLDHLAVSLDHLVVGNKLQLPHHQHLSHNSKQQHHLQSIQEPFLYVYSVTPIYGLEMGQVFGITLFL
jgi:hypothetical protein